MTDPYRTAAAMDVTIRLQDADERTLWAKWVESFLSARLSHPFSDSIDDPVWAKAVERADFLILERRKRL